MSASSDPAQKETGHQPDPDVAQARPDQEGFSDHDSLLERVYGVSDLSHYSPADRLIIEAADLLLYSAIRVVCSTLRWQVRGGEHLDAIIDSNHHPILVFWHEGIFPATYFFRNRGIVVMSSASRDAEYTSRVIKRFGFGTARGSATRGGGRALAEMGQCLNNGMEVGFSIDGPRGPARVAKPGAVTLARHTGQAILPFHVALSRRLELPSWDRLQIPAPFSRAAVLISEPIYVARNSNAQEVAAKQLTLQTALNRLCDEGEAWRKGK